MNDSMTAHQFKIKEPNGWSTYCRTDNTLHEDEVSHSDSLPATSHPGLPPATRSDVFTQRETGDRNGCCGHISLANYPVSQSCPL